MMTTKTEPEILLALVTAKDGSFYDKKGEIIPFLKDLYQFEVKRIPVRPVFEKKYNLPYFSVNMMLDYYMNPFGDQVVVFVVDEHTKDNPIILKKTIRA